MLRIGSNQADINRLQSHTMSNTIYIIYYTCMSTNIIKTNYINAQMSFRVGQRDPSLRIDRLMLGLFFKCLVRSFYTRQTPIFVVSNFDRQIHSQSLSVIKFFLPNLHKKGTDLEFTFKYDCFRFLNSDKHLIHIFLFLKNTFLEKTVLLTDTQMTCNLSIARLMDELRKNWIDTQQEKQPGRLMYRQANIQYA